MQNQEANDQATPAVECRALVPFSPVQTSAHVHDVQPRPASFLAHLIATRQALPQTRERRRIEPEFGAAIYAAAGHAPVQTIHALSQAA